MSLCLCQHISPITGHILMKPLEINHWIGYNFVKLTDGFLCG